MCVKNSVAYTYLNIMYFSEKDLKNNLNIVNN
jgi:hypothetical protein